jgi:TetR/AcrR family transcriptional regulator, regulator of autoinduction and epiphytic fitness
LHWVCKYIMLPCMPASFPKVDGRNARGERTRTAVAVALLSLFEAGHLRPTAVEIAERAGVSLRSVFQHFEDLESLYEAVAAEQMSRLAHYIWQDEGTGPLAPRIEAFVKRRCELLELITPVRRAAILREPFSEVLAARLKGAHEMARAEVERMFAPELSALSPKERGIIAAALDVASNWPAWDACRRMNALSIKASTEVMTRTISALLKEGR